MLWHSDRRNPHDCHSHPLLARKVSHHRDHSIHLLPKISAIRGRICHYFMTNFHTQYYKYGLLHQSYQTWYIAFAILNHLTFVAMYQALPKLPNFQKECLTYLYLLNPPTLHTSHTTKVLEAYVLILGKTTNQSYSARSRKSNVLSLEPKQDEPWTEVDEIFQHASLISYCILVNKFT